MAIKHPFDYQQPTPAMVEDITKVREACKGLGSLLAGIGAQLPFKEEPVLVPGSSQDSEMFAAYAKAAKEHMAYLESDEFKNNQRAMDYIRQALACLEMVSMWANKGIVFAVCEAYRAD